MARPTFDAQWLYERELLHFDRFGQRFDVDGVPRWANTDAPSLYDGNHAAVGPNVGLIPDTLVQIVDAQRRDGATPCVDIYGTQDDRDQACLGIGLKRLHDQPIVFYACLRGEVTVPPPFARDDNRTAPPVYDVAPGDWSDTVLRLNTGAVRQVDRERVMYEALADDARFYAIFIGDQPVAAITRFDGDGVSRVTSLFVDPDFRKTGFARACAQRAVAESPHDVVYLLGPESNRAVAALARTFGGRVAAADAVRRYIAP